MSDGKELAVPSVMTASVLFAGASAVSECDEDSLVS